MSIVTCSRCGHAAPPDARQCPKCGITLGSRPRGAASARFQPGDVIDGRYEVLERLPGGGMGELYKVRHIHLAEFRVIKILRADQLTDDTQRKRFFQEAKIAASIKNSNVGLLHDFATLPDGTYYMVEEFIDGLTISRSLRAGRRFTLGEIVDIAHQVLSGLIAIHEKGIVHRDISPDNIMLCQHDGTMQARIIDLGIAKHVVAQEGPALTSAGLFVGKPHYASPEQLRMMETDEAIDHRTDLYSLGVVIFEMIVGKVPFEAATPLAYLLKQISEEVTTVNRDVSGVVPPELDAFIVRLLKTKRGERFASARDALRALDDVIAAIPQLLYRTEFLTNPPEESFPRAKPKVRKESTDEIPFAQLAAMVEHDRTQPGEAAAPPTGLLTPDDDDGMPTEVQRLDELMMRTQSNEQLAASQSASAPTLSTAEVPIGATVPQRTVPASVAIAPPPPPPPPSTETQGGTSDSPRRASSRGLLITLAAVAFVIVVAVGGWLFYLLLERFTGTAKDEAATTTATPAPTATLETTTIAPTATTDSPPATTLSTAREVAPTATVAAVTEPQKPPATPRQPKPPKATEPPPTETVVPTATVEPEPPPLPPTEPVEPVVREGDIVGPGEGVVDAQLLKKAEPLTPPSSAVMGNRGFAMFSVLVGIDGRVEMARLIRSSGSEAFDELATAAAKRTTYTPATKAGTRVRMWRTLRYDVKVRGTI
ncbi:MAG: TonB family protein [Acidobacteria bacterium]|nr:TonB family protein [Acidobacteriota bacterium]